MSSNRAWVQVTFVLSVLPVSMRKCSLPSRLPSSARLQCTCDWLACPLSGLLSPELHCFLPPSLWSVTGNRGAVGDSFSLSCAQFFELLALTATVSCHCTWNGPTLSWIIPSAVGPMIPLSIVYLMTFFLYIYILLALLCVWMFTCLYVWALHACLLPLEARRESEVSGTGVTDCYEPPCWCWRPNLDVCKSSQWSQALPHLSSPWKQTAV